MSIDKGYGLWVFFCLKIYDNYFERGGILRGIGSQPKNFLLWSNGSSLTLRKKEVVSCSKMFIYRANRKKKAMIIIGFFGV